MLEQLVQLVQIVGASAILAAFTLSQLRWLDTESLRYLVPNVLGSATLAVDAVLTRQWGFVLLESVWALVSGAGVVRTSSVALSRPRSG